MATKTTIEMAREAAGDDWGLFQEYMPEIHRLAALVRADERARMATDKSKEAMKLALGALESKDTWGSSIREAKERASTALREALAEQPAQQEPCGWQFFQDGKWHNGMETNNHRANTEAAGVPVRDVYPSPQPPAQPLTEWIDPNDKTQKQYLPGIGVPVLFCHDGNTYFGRHTGGSFHYGPGATSRHFNTWECRWMPLPAAHGITKGGAA